MGKLFHIGDILTVTTGVMVSPRLMDGLYDILNYMTGDKLFTHQLPRAGDECSPWLLRQHPQLANVKAGGITKANYEKRLAAWVAEFGETLLVEPIPTDDHEHKEPYDELVAMRGTDEGIIIVKTD